MDLKRLHRSIFDWGNFAVAAACMLAAWPFLSNSSLPQQTDAELHIFRLAELSRLVREGILYPRWAPNFYFGYGYPIFNYYAPLTYYLGLPLDLLPRLGPVQATKILFIVGLFAAGLGMYGFVRLVWGKTGALIAAVAYVYSPYILFIDPHARGDLPEFLSFGIFALALWSLESLHQKYGAPKFVVAALLIAAVVLIHNLMSMVFFGLLLGWMFWMTIPRAVKAVRGTELEVSELRPYVRWPLVLGLGLGISGFFVVPVILEQSAVNLSTLVGQGGHYDFRNHFLTIDELFSTAMRIDWGATEPDYGRSLGQAQVVFVAIGLVALFSQRTRRRSQLLYFTAAFVSVTVMMLPLSNFLWEHVPLLPFMQFPWRFLGPASALGAILAGAGFQTLSERLAVRSRMMAIVIAVLFLIVPSLTLVQVSPWPEDFGPTTRLRVLQEELAGRWLGTTSTSDFVPVTVDVIPGPETSMLEDFYAGRPLDRINRVTLPIGTSVISDHVNPLSLRYMVSGDQDFLLRLFLFDFPGWEVSIDGIPAEKELGRPEGFIVIPVPAGEHLVEVWFGSTGPRRLGVLVSLTALFLTFAFAYIFKEKPEVSPDKSDVAPAPAVEIKKVGQAVALIVLILFILNAGVLAPLGILHLDSNGLIAQPADSMVVVDFGGQVHLLGYDVSDYEVSQGEELQVTAYWKAQQELQINYQVFVHLFDEKGRLVAQSDKLNPGDFPSKRWPLDKYVRDRHRIRIPTELPDGQYSIALGLWVAQEGWRLPILDSDRMEIGDSYRLPGIITIQ